MSSIHRKAWAWLCLLLVAGCGAGRPLPKTIAECRDFAIRARDEAEGCRQARKPKDAAAAAEWALMCSDLAGEMLKGMASPSAAHQDARKEVAEAARTAKLYAELADEDARLEEALSSWKAKAYRAGRSAALTATLKGLAMAARQAKQSGPSAPPEPGSSPALASDLAKIFCDRKPRPDGTPDWDGIAQDMDTMAGTPPPRLGGFLTVALLSGGATSLALCEMGMLDHDVASADADMHAVAHFLRGVVLSMNSLPRLAVREVEEAARLSGDTRWSGPQTLGTLHTILSLHHLSRKELAAADKEIVRSMQVWPDNPMGTFLTGEKLAADGRYEEAADSLQKSTAGTKHAWLARRFAARAREVRDRRGETPPLFMDQGFLCDLAIHLVAEKAGEKAAGSLNDLVSAARAFGRNLLDKLGMKP